MACKSLPIINKVNTSMIWYSTYYEKHYKWLSSQTLYFMYFLNKMLVYLRFFFRIFLWLPFEKSYILDNKKLRQPNIKNKGRYFKPVTAYIVNIKNVLIVYNVYYLTSLAKFQKTPAQEDIIPFAENLFSSNRKKALYFKARNSR